MPLISYDIRGDDPSWANFKEGHMVKVTFEHKDNKERESFWVLIDKIDKIEGEIVSGYVSNKLITFNKEGRLNLRLGDIITFKKHSIKRISSRYYSKEESSLFLENCKNNPITDYFESLNTKFKSSNCS